MRLVDFFEKEAIIPELKSTDRKGVITELITSLASSGAINPDDVDAVTKAVIARENQGSTGFGKGVAVPHAKPSCVSRVVATIGRSSSGVDFAALDRAPVYTVVILLSPPAEADNHLAAMTTIFRHLQNDNFRRFLRQADTREAIGELLDEAEEIIGV
ncbi:MAG: PTS system fructose-specific EIIABC component [Phycisphaerae bacterium]|nr:PTS system fructose-specific EIIABC component [Phycisphaerae bacterium]